MGFFGDVFSGIGDAFSSGFTAVSNFGEAAFNTGSDIFGGFASQVGAQLPGLAQQAIMGQLAQRRSEAGRSSPAVASRLRGSIPQPDPSAYPGKSCFPAAVSQAEVHRPHASTRAAQASPAARRIPAAPVSTSARSPD